MEGNLNINNLKEVENNKTTTKAKQMVKMLTFRVVPEYYREIEKVAKTKKTSVSKLIRTYIKEGLIRDKEITSSEEKDFIKNSNMF